MIKNRNKRRNKNEKNFKAGVYLLLVVIFIIIVLLYNMELCKKDNKQIQEKISVFENEIEELNTRMNVVENKMSTKEILNEDSQKENKNLKDEENESDMIDETDYLKNIQMIDISEETKKAICSEPKISFEFPKEWKIVSNNNWSIWNVQIEKSPDCYITIQKIDNESNLSLKELLSLDYGSIISEEGNIKVSNYNAYYKKYTFGDANYFAENISTVIDAGNSNYYEVAFIISADEDGVYDNVSHKFIEYEKYYNQLLSTIKF